MADLKPGTAVSPTTAPGSITPANPQNVSVGARPTLYDNWRGFFERPDVAAGLLQFGANALQPLRNGQSPIGSVANAAVEGFNAAGRVQDKEFAQAQQQFDNSLARRGVETAEARTDIASRGADVAERRAATDERRAAFDEKMGEAGLDLQRERLNVSKASLGLQRAKNEQDMMLAQKQYDLAIRSWQTNAQQYVLDKAIHLAEGEREGYLKMAGEAIKGVSEAAALKGMREPEKMLSFMEDAITRLKPEPLDIEGQMRNLGGTSAPAAPAVGTPIPDATTEASVDFSTITKPEQLDAPAAQTAIAAEAAKVGMTPEELTNYLKQQLRAKAGTR